MLPELIEIVPLTSPLRAEITVPGSKSITNRALVLAALAEGETVLERALWSEDTQVMVECLQELGWMVNVNPDPHEACNRSITVYGLGGHVPRGGTATQPLELFVGNAGTAARFLSALVSLGEGVYRLHGVPRMHERPQAALFQALHQLGYHIEAPQDKLPALIHGAGTRAGKCQVSIAESSQFASALLLCAKRGGWSVEVTGENAEESPYVAMTSKLIARFPKFGKFEIEPDTSSGSYFLAVNMIWGSESGSPSSEGTREVRAAAAPPLAVEVSNWPKTGWQMDQAFIDYLTLPEQVSRLTDLGDSIMTAIVMAPLQTHATRFTELGRLRLQECERVAALRAELTRCGADGREEDDTLTVFPSRAALHGAEIETYNDHRIAMCFAILGLKVPGIKIKNPSCVKKTFPNFFQKLAAAPPAGLGATILEGRSGRPLAAKELFAE